MEHQPLDWRHSDGHTRATQEESEAVARSQGLAHIAPGWLPFQGFPPGSILHRATFLMPSPRAGQPASPPALDDPASDEPEAYHTRSARDAVRAARRGERVVLHCHQASIAHYDLRRAGPDVADGITVESRLKPQATENSHA